jgi:hypothetical protein
MPKETLTQDEPLFWREFQPLEVVTMRRDFFEQIRDPHIPEEEQDAWLVAAAEHAIAIVVPGQTWAWLLVHDDTGLWRWAFIDQCYLHKAIAEHPWLKKLPQIFLIG